MSAEDSTKFLGLDKGQFAAVAAVLLLAVLAVQGFTLYRIAGLADQGAQSHEAVCSYKANLASQYRQTEHVLGLTHAQLVRQYGARYAGLIAAVPKATLLHSIAREKAAADSLTGLVCR